MITVKDMRALEQNSGIPQHTLMARAGSGVYTELKKKIDIAKKQILVICYHGNNGGDGFVAANLLSKEAEVDLLFLGDEEKLREPAKYYYKEVVDNSTIQFVDAETADFSSYAVIIDAIFGIGLTGKLFEEIYDVVQVINASPAFKVSLDVPTGLNADTGEGIEQAVQADLIVTFHDIKPGLEQLKDKVVVVDIGLGDNGQNNV